MRSLILGTAGHIDHGKTALIRALTGIETDRLREEQERGITIDLGFAQLPGDDVKLGVVDVPGHEGFVRNMLAGATGMDVVVLVVAADEGVMPQTREHLAILSLLGVDRLVVALSKIDLVDDEWLELVEDDVRQTLEARGFHDAPFARVSSRTGQGVAELRALLLATAALAPEAGADDLMALPIDRVFTVRGTGTVVTGTLVSGGVRVGERVRLLPTGLQARVRGIQVHGADVADARAGSRVAVALAGDGIERGAVARGEVVVSSPAWAPSHMLTVEFRVLDESGWSLSHNQRVRVHLGTAEVMARCVVFGDTDLEPGARGWGQLRLEAPVVARGGQRGVLRSFSPVTTIAGFRVVEPVAPKRGRTAGPVAERLGAALAGAAPEAVAEVVRLAGLVGVVADELPVRTGLTPGLVADALDHLASQGGGATPGGRWVAAEGIDGLGESFLAEVERVHRDEPFRRGVSVEHLRARVPDTAATGLADLVLGRLQSAGQVRHDAGVVARSGFEPRLNEAQLEIRVRLMELYESAGLAPPFVEELPSELQADPAFEVLIEDLERAGALVRLDHGLFIDRSVLARAVEEIRARLGGREGLGPADFREAVPVTRRHLLPILVWCDEEGVTRREGTVRSVPVAPHPGDLQATP